MQNEWGEEANVVLLKVAVCQCEKVFLRGSVSEKLVAAERKPTELRRLE